MTGHPVRDDYKQPDDPDVLPFPPDAFVVAPATFNTVNKWANGISDTLALGLLNEGLASGQPIIAVPNPNQTLARHPAFARSIAFLRDNEVTVIFDPRRIPLANAKISENPAATCSLGRRSRMRWRSSPQGLSPSRKIPEQPRRWRQQGAGMEISDHWWWRPGWRAGRRMYTWHVTFADLPAVHDLAARAQGRLAGLIGLDLVPARWLHLTVQDIGFTDEVPAADVDAIAAAARRHLADVEPPQVRMGPAHVAAEGVLLDVRPADGLTAVRSRLRAAIADIWPGAAVPGPDDWVPHVSIAYSRVSGPADSYESALAGGNETVNVTIGSVRLIVLGRDEHVYEWSEHARVPLGPGPL